MLFVSRWAGAQEQSPPERPYGIAAGAFASKFIGGMSGPETPLSETRYQDTFNTGYGLRLELFKNYSDAWRGQIGLVYARWSGKFFVGGEFPAGAQFGDLSLAGVYVGFRENLGSPSSFRPYWLGNLGVVHLSSLTVVSGGTSIPYWGGNWRDYLEIGIGVAHKITGGALTADLRLHINGKPKSLNFPIAEATGGSSLLFGIGYEWGLH